MAKLPHQSTVTPTADLDAANKTYTDSSGGSALVESNLWSAPATPHELDVEFDSGAIPDGWAWTTAPEAAAIDPHASFTGTGPRVSYGGRRASWLMVQPSDEGGIRMYLHKAHTIPTNFFMWARMSFNSRSGVSPTNNDFSCNIMMSTTDTGKPDEDNRVDVFINEADVGNTQVNAFGVESGLADFEYVGPNLYGSQMATQPVEYIGIQKLGSVYHYWSAPSSGSWMHLGSYTGYTGPAFDRVSINFQNAVQTSPGNMIMGCDFVRFSDDGLFLP